MIEKFLLISIINFEFYLFFKNIELKLYNCIKYFFIIKYK